MLLIVLVSCYFVFGRGEMVEVKTIAYSPPTQDEIVNAYFRKPKESAANPPVSFSTSNTSESFNESVVDTVNTHVGQHSSPKELNGTGSDKPALMKVVHDYVRSGFFKNYLSTPVELTTYKYPTAIWTSQTYEESKNRQKYNFKPAYNKSPLNTVYRHYGPGYVSTVEKDQRRGRGKTKWKDYQNTEYADILDPKDVLRTNKTAFVDKFLEQSLSNYLASSNLKETIGPVSVKTFSEILKNITDQKPKKFQTPYDENKELRMKFRKEVLSRQRNETKPPQEKFLEKQLQKRLEKVQDMFNEKDKDKILANMWKYTALNNRTSDISEEKRNNISNSRTTVDAVSFVNVNETTEMSLLSSSSSSTVASTTQAGNLSVELPKASGGRFRGTVKYSQSKYSASDRVGITAENKELLEQDKKKKNVLKLTAEESSYYRRNRFPSLTFIGQQARNGVIPGRPYVDYPVFRFPPPTKFRCPHFRGNKPRMFADRETRCQVFYICTGNGPTTAMLCPNGTMFNEHFLVCDWWYNVNC